MAIPITTSGCGAASGAAFLEDSIIAVNGFDCTISNVTNGCIYNTVRPYDFISTSKNCILATQGTCSNKLYIIDSCFNEIDGICLPNIGGPLLSAYLMCNGKILLTYRKAIVIANTDGSTGGIVANSNCESTDFISAIPNNKGLILAFNDGYRDTIQYRDCNGTISNCVLPSCVSIKSFAQSYDCTVYGLFAKGYPYRYLIPVLVDGVLNCVSESCFGTNLCCS